MGWPVTEGLAWVKEERGVSNEEVAEGHRKVTVFLKFLAIQKEKNQRWQVQTLDS